MENNAANVNQRVGQRVAQLRTAAGLSQRELAAQISLRLGREFGTVTATRLEGGKRPITVDELAAAAQALGVTTSDLLSDDDLAPDAVEVLNAARDMMMANGALDAAVREWVRARHRLDALLDAEPQGRNSLRLTSFAGVNEVDLDDLISTARTEAEGTI
ncbi:helix-turn-helix domain-containing protein [Mycolicibacterium psychrotolerans]|uniref:HTH cro/C1-type domain-containing protein n=1 Tax=Mycolicibacterium psychrotolerans TaxID=216929 RepID=A0A7I7MDI3_9MYCO|nr:helix-turn-helix transcriptional regulator [Mycolicibacterium psychrotolerans]BBX69583.1 hypothetical protein MPSYJ_30440 [Mycolicibacterium psychrotolerans]